MDTDSFVLSVNTKDIIKDLKNLEDIFDMKISFFDLYYTVIKVRGEYMDIDNQYENVDNGYISFNDFINPNLYIGIEKNIEILK